MDLTNRADYSDKEQQLFDELGYGEMTQHIDAAPQLYRMVGEHCFIHNLKGKAVESLRRCLLAQSTCSCYRATKEWDDLIDLD